MIRCPVQQIPLFNFDNQVLRVGQSFLQLGKMEGNSLQPVECLISRIVVIKLREDSRIDQLKFAVCLGKQLEQLKIGNIPDIGDRVCLRVKDRDLIGYRVEFNALTPEESIKIQTHGIGGKHKMGCGVFEAIQ